MGKRLSVFAAAGLMLIGSLAARAQEAPKPRPGGWVLPPTAAEEKNPFAGDAKAIAAGKELYDKTCKKCHGPGGKGDGPDADPDAMEDMNLTVARRAARNPDGIVFYKIWNGRAKPKMPAQKDELTRDQVWQIVSYAQTLRSKP